MGTATPPRTKAPAFNPAASAQARLEASEVARAQQPSFGEPSVAPMDTAEPSPSAPSLTAQLDQAGTFGHQFGQMAPPPASSGTASIMGNGLLGNLAQARPQTIPPVQSKLTIGTPGDKFEQEADQMAARVVAMPDSAVQRETMSEEEEDELAQARFQMQRQEMPEEEEEALQAKPQLQREVMPEEEEEETLQTKPQLQREAMPEEEEEETLQAKPQLQREAMPEDEEEELLQTKPQLQTKDGAPEAPANFEGQLAQHKGRGQPLSDETRAFMEPRFGADFSNVRVHETPDLANTIQAQAFTHGQDIYFNSGKYSPGSSGGKELLAHELTHVVQQNNLKHGVQSSEIKLQTQEGPSIGPMTPEETRRYIKQSKTFEFQISEIYALGPILKMNFKIRRQGHPKWSYFHFFGAGPALAFHIPIIRRPNKIETHTTIRPMSVQDFLGRGYIGVLSVPNTDIKYLKLGFTQGPNEAGFSSVWWTLDTGISAKFGVGGYWGTFDRGHGLKA